MITNAVTPSGISQAESLIRPYIRRTPVIEISGEEYGLVQSSLVFKLEMLQHGGSFKARGGFTNLLMRPIPSAGVVAASGGNHAVAVAYAAQKLGLAAKVFVPAVTSPAKLALLREYGAEISISGERYADALAASELWAAQTGALPVHAFDQPETLLGQGSAGLEFQRQAPNLDTLLIAVGGGGLMVSNLDAQLFVQRIQLLAAPRQRVRKCAPNA